MDWIPQLMLLHTSLRGSLILFLASRVFFEMPKKVLLVASALPGSKETKDDVLSYISPIFLANIIHLIRSPAHIEKGQ